VRAAIIGLFHCGRCGSFFKAAVGAAAFRRCPDCGGDPAVALDDRRVRKLTAEGTVVRDLGADQRAADESPEAGGGAAHRIRKRRQIDPVVRRLVIFLGVWLLVLGVFAVAMMTFNRRREREDFARATAYKANRVVVRDPLEISLDSRERALVEDGLQECSTALFGYLQSPLPETRSQWVCNPLEMLGPMTRFDEAFASYAADQMPVREYVGVVNTPGGTLIESLWKAPDGRRIEAIFRQDKEGWRLDWESFVRYSETPWVMFLAGGGKSEQDFRLLARERLPDERRAEPTLSVVFHPPRFGNPGEAGPASPEFVVRRLSEPGRKLEALFKAARAGKVPFGAKVPSQDPQDMIRLRVRVRRIEDQGIGRKFEVEDVLAGHWLGIEATGIPAAVDDGGVPPGELRKPAASSGE